MQLNEDIIEIQGNDGLIRRGIITMPATTEPSMTGIVLLPAGLKYRTGPQRLYVTMARHFAGLGYHVLRIDPLGIGESDGEMPALPNTKIFRTVEEGRFADDALLAAETMKECFSIKKVIAGGICGGAITSQLAAARKSGVIDGVLSINTSVSLAGVASEDNLTLSETQAKKNYKAYLKKIFSRHAWARILKGQSSFRDIFKTLYTVSMGRVFKRKPIISLEPLKNENPKFIKSFRQLDKSGIKQFFLFAGNDNRWSEFQDIILNRYLDGHFEGNSYKIDIVPDANHEFHFREWQQSAIEKIANWITESFAQAKSP